MALTYFAQTNSGNEQLWITDGTAAGTRIVKVFAGSAISQLIMVGARVYFSVDDGVHGQELWSSDGTAAGTVLVADINPGATGSFPTFMTNVNGTVFFEASDGIHGIELWRTDGNAAGTTMVKDILPGAGSSMLAGPFVDLNGTLFFVAQDGLNGAELWKSDGTAAGTVMVKDINPGAANSFPAVLTNVNGTLFFVADDGTHGTELWKSDGTVAGTVLVKDINPGGSSIIGFPFASINGTVFFDATDGTNGAELWKSDGTAAGTVMVKDINPGAGDSFPEFFINANGTLLFAASDGVNGFELWRSDGTAAGTMMVKDIDPGASGSIFSQPFVNINGTVFFDATDGTSGFELWKTDGTAAGTMMVKDIVAGAGNSFPEKLTNVNGVLEFYAFDGTAEGLFRSDGTAAGTIEIATNVDVTTPIGFTTQPVANDMNGDRRSDILWRSTNGTLAGWSMNGGAITSSSALTMGGAAVNPGSSWNVAGISDFNGDGNADVLWRNADGTLADWTMSGNVITSSAVLNSGGTPIMPLASWNVIGTGDFDGDTRSDILWRNSDGTVVEWGMNGANIMSSSVVTSGGVVVTPDASWSVAGIGDFNGDNRRDVLWRNASGEMVVWLMNGSTISNGGTTIAGMDVTSSGISVRPDASWSVAGIGDFNADGNSDILWRRSDGTLAEWLMNGSTISSSGAITSSGVAVTPDASWHVVEIGDFNGDSNSDILWRNDNGTMAEWLMNGTTIAQSVTPSSGAFPISPDATWSTQAKPTNFG